MHYFITGATGILGQNLILKLINEQQAIVALKRKNSIIPDCLKLFPENQLKWIEGDILDTSSYSDYINPDTKVIHAAASVSFQRSEEESMYSINVEGTKQIIDTALDKKVNKFIHISSIASIGRVKGLTLLNENTKWQDSPDHSAYAESKYYSELEVWRGFEEGLNGFIINPSVILAQSDWTKSSSTLFKKMASGTIYHPSGSINTVDVRDVVDSILLLDQKKVNHERFICNGSFNTYHAFLSTVAKAFGIASPKISINFFMLKTLARLSSILVLFGKKPIITTESIKAMSSINEFDSSKLIKELDFNFRSMDETINWSVPYYIKKYNL